MNLRHGAVIALVVVQACSSGPSGMTAPVDAGLLRVNGPVLTFQFARTRPTAVALTADHTLRLLSLPDGKELQTIDVGDRPVSAFDYAPDGQTVAVGDRTGLVSVWDAATGKSRFERKLPRYPGQLMFSPDGRRLAIAAEGDAVEIVDVANGAILVKLGAAVGGTGALAFSPNGEWVAAGGGDTIVRIHDAATGKEVAQNREFLMVPLAVAFTADSASVLATSGDKVVTVIDAATGRTTRRFDKTLHVVTGFVVSPDGKSVATLSRKSEDITKPDQMVVRASDTWQPHMDWLPPMMPVGTSWTSEGQLIVAMAAPEGVRLWRLH